MSLPIRPRRSCFSRWMVPALSVFTLACSVPVAAAQQLTPDQAAEMLLNSARKAFNEKNHAFARDRFKEFIAKYGNHKDVPAARYGLGLALLEGAEKDYAGAVEALQPVAGIQDFPDRAFALYYLGLAHRGVGNAALAQAIAKPPEAAQHRATANQRFDQAAAQFTAAIPAFTARVKAPPAADAKELPADLEWAARARADLAEMQLQTNKLKEAQATAAPFLSDPVLSKSRYRGLGTYYHGFASFSLKEYNVAGRSLSQLAPFNDPVFGVHARYLIARTHHLAEEGPEAAAHYEAVIKGYEEQKKAAAQTLQNPAALKDNPDERARLDALVKNPPPAYVARASFYWGVLLYEQGKFSDALARFAPFAQQYAGSPLIPDAQLRAGFCQVQLKDWVNAMKTLQPFEQQQPRLADQALWWFAKAQVGAADPTKPAEYDQALKASLETFRRAAERAGQLAATDPEAKVRRGEILIEQADTQQLAKLFKEAAATYQQVLTENNNPDRAEEVLQHQATALHLAGMHKESDDLCVRFQQTYPKSPLLPAVLFRHAENAFLSAVTAAANPNLPNRDQELKTRFGEAIKRHQQVIDKYPEFVHVNLARLGLGTSHYRLGEYEKALAALSAIPESERTGDLATVPYLLADCILRTTPTDAADALAAGRARQQLTNAIKLLETFIGAQPNSPQVPDALLKVGYCHQQTTAFLADPPARTAALTSARQAYEQLMQRFANHPLNATAIFERAKCMAQVGDVTGAINELNRFNAAPLNATPAAPLALLRLSALLRAQNKVADAVKLLEQCRATHEANLLKDPARADLVPLIHYHHGLAVKESGKLPEARGIFENIVKTFPARPEAAEAAWRAGQCRKAEALAKIDAADKALKKPMAKPEEITAANSAFQAGLKDLRDTAQYFQDQAGQFAQKAAGSEAHLRMLYEAAWSNRAVTDHEIAAARLKLQQDGQKKRQEELAKQTPPGAPVPVVPLPDIPLKTVPIQPAEQKARDHYKAMITAAPQSLMAGDARFELAEMHAQRDEHDPAIALLRQSLEIDPPDSVERVNLRLGACLLAKNLPKEAFVALDAIARNDKSPLAAEARYRAGECLLQQGGQGAARANWEEAVKYLIPFRDQQPLQNLPGITDRALLRLGHAYGHLGQWDPSRQAMEILLQRFPQSPWAMEARYGIGWAFQNQKQFDQAANFYAQVTNGTATEVAAKAQLQTGLCRLEQKRHPEAANALLVVPFTYDYPELSALALCEASRAFVEMKQPEQAARLLERVVKDHAQSQWAEVARQRLAEIKANGKKG